MSFTSYAQNFEDVILWRALKHVKNGFYIDVGAMDPDQDSVTKAFYEHGWHGINIEPVAQWYAELEQKRARDVNLQVVVGAHEGETILYEIPDTGLSTVHKEIAERHETEQNIEKIERRISVRTLNEICLEHHVALLNFLKIDVEGDEKMVLEGIDFSIVRPWIILVESTFPNTQKDSHAAWDPILMAAKYEFVYFDGLNRFYVSEQHQELKDSFKTPPNYFDDFVLSGGTPFCNHIANQAKQAIAEASAATVRSDQIVLLIEERNQVLAASQAGLVEKQAHIQWLQNELNAAKVRLEELIEQQAYSQWLKNEWNIAKARLEQLAGELAVKSEALTARETTLTQQQTHSQWLNKELDAAKAQLDELVAEIAISKQATQRLSEQLAEKNQVLNVREDELAEQRGRSLWLVGELEFAKTKINELTNSSNHWWSMADGMNHELQSVYKSQSWKLTKPLRLLHNGGRWFVNGSFAWLTFAPGSRPQRTLRNLYVKLRNILNHNPRGKILILRILTPFPNFLMQIRKFGRHNNSIMVSNIPGRATDIAGPKDLSRRAQNIYAYLKAAKENQREIH